MSTEANNIALVRRYYESANAGDEATLLELNSPDLVCWIGGRSEPIRGLEANLEMERQFRAAFSNYETTPLDIIAQGDKVAVRRSWRLTHTGDYMGLPPTGREVHGTTMELIRIQDGQVAEMWTESDGYSFMVQLGALPAPESEHGL